LDSNSPNIKRRMITMVGQRTTILMGKNIKYKEMTERKIY
jgi:hypothetical protein